MKRLRQQAIRDVLARHAVRTQGELVLALGERGIHATQATVSRDIREMGLAKVGPPGAQRYALPARPVGPPQTPEERLALLLRDIPLELRASGLLLVIRAVPGSAHAIAAALDRACWPEVVGTIAGDDTLFVACADEAGLARVRARLADLRGQVP